MFLSDKQVASRYSVTRETVWKWTREKKSFPQPFRLSPGCTRWRLDDLLAWEAAQAAPKSGEAA